MAGGRMGHMRNPLAAIWNGGTAAGLGDGPLLERFAAQRGRDDLAAEAAFSALVARHGPMVLSTRRALTRQPHDADDAFQATFLVLARRAGSIRQPDRLGPWLHGVAVQVARKARSRGARRIEVSINPNDAELPSAQPTPDLRAALAEEAAAVHEEVGRLPERYRRVVVLCHLEGLTHQEAAHRLGCPTGTVSVRLMRAKDLLRSRLVRRGIAPSTTGALAAVLAARPARAAVPETLARSTIHAAPAYAAGETTAPAASAVALAQGALSMILVTKLAIATTVVATLILVAAEVSINTQQAGSSNPAPPVGTSKTPAPTQPRSNASIAAPPEVRRFLATYTLEPGEVLKRVDPADPILRHAYLEHIEPGWKRTPPEEILTLILRQGDGKLNRESATVGGPLPDRGRQLSYLLSALAGVPPQDVEGEENLLESLIIGDFVIRDGASTEAILISFEQILCEEIGLPVRLSVRDAEREVIVARGHFEFRPVPNSPAERIELYGATLTDPNIGDSGTGSFVKFLDRAGSFMEPNSRIISEAEAVPDRVSWHVNYRSPSTLLSWAEDHDAFLVLKHLADQTGLTFEAEQRPVRILFVERVEPPGPEADR